MRDQTQSDPTVSRNLLLEFQHVTAERTPTPPHSPEEPMLEQLNDREEDVLRLLAGGLSNKEIATELSLSEGTIKNHISAIMAKLHANDRTQAVLTALKHGLVDLD